jgi:hypothetical protein
MPEKIADILLRAEGRGIDPDFIAQGLERIDQLRGAQAKPLLIDLTEGEGKGRLRFVGGGGDEEHLVQIEGDPHFLIGRMIVTHGDPAF